MPLAIAAVAGSLPPAPPSSAAPLCRVSATYQPTFVIPPTNALPGYMLKRIQVRLLTDCPDDGEARVVFRNELRRESVPRRGSITLTHDVPSAELPRTALGGVSQGWRVFWIAPGGREFEVRQRKNGAP